MRVFYESVFPIRWSKYWSFSISPSTENSGLFSCRIDWVWSPCCPRESQESSPVPQFKSINSLALSLLYGPLGVLATGPQGSPSVSLVMILLLGLHLLFLALLWIFFRSLSLLGCKIFSYIFHVSLSCGLKLFSLLLPKTTQSWVLLNSLHSIVHMTLSFVDCLSYDDCISYILAVIV